MQSCSALLSSIRVSNLTYFHSDGTLQLKDLNFSTNKGCLALVGSNGAGKTTLLRLLAGVLLPTVGTVTVSSTPVTFLQQSDFSQSIPISEVLGLREECCAADRVLTGSTSESDLSLATSFWEVEESIYSWFDFYNLPRVSLNEAVSSLSLGQQQKLKLIKGALATSDILLLDEPSNHLDKTGKEKLIEFITSGKRTVVLASHDRDLLACANQFLFLNRNRGEFFSGSFEEFIRAREAVEIATSARVVWATENLQKTAEESQDVRERQEKRTARGKKSAAKLGLPQIIIGMRKRNAEKTSAKLSKTHELRVAAAEEELSRAKDALTVKPRVRFDLAGTKASSTLLFHGTDLNFEFFPNKRLWKEGVTLTLRRGEKVALIGDNGTGKSTLLKVVAGQLDPHFGAVLKRPRSFLALDQSFSVLDPESSALANLQRLVPDTPVSELRIALGRLGFYRDDVLKLVCHLSGGEKLKVCLACAIAGSQAPELIILDEPTNNLDMDATELLEDTLAHFEGTVLVVSHEKRFLENIRVTRSVRLSEAGFLCE